HFPSKKALLEEAVRQHYDATAGRSRHAVAPRAETVREALHPPAGTAREIIEGGRELLRIMLRDFGEFAELSEQMLLGVLANLYRAGSAWISFQRERGVADVADPEATAAVLLASLTYYPLLDALTGHSPGDIAPERFL